MKLFAYKCFDCDFIFATQRALDSEDEADVLYCPECGNPIAEHLDHFQYLGFIHTSTKDILSNR